MNVNVSRVAAGVALAALAGFALTGCTSNSTSTADASASEAAASEAAASAEAEAVAGVGAMAPANPVVADVENLAAGKQLEVPVANGQPVILVMDQPADWTHEVSPDGVATWEDAPGTKDLEKFPRLNTVKLGRVTVTMTDKAGKTVTLLINVVPGPKQNTAPAPASKAPESKAAESAPASDMSTPAPSASKKK